MPYEVQTRTACNRWSIVTVEAKDHATAARKAEFLTGGVFVTFGNRGGIATVVNA